MVKSSFEGFDFLDKLEQKANKLEEGKELSLGELFNDSFMARHTRFATIDELFDSAGFKIESLADIESIGEPLDAHISENTNFSSWEELQTKAVAEQVAKQLRI